MSGRSIEPSSELTMLTEVQFQFWWLNDSWHRSPFRTFPSLLAFSREEISNIDLNLCLSSASSFHIRENMESVADLEDMKTNFQPMVMLSGSTTSRIF